MNPRRNLRTTQLLDRSLNIDEARLIADLRIMHAKVDELYHLITSLKAHHSEHDIHRYADAPLLARKHSAGG